MTEKDFVLGTPRRAPSLRKTIEDSLAKGIVGEGATVEEAIAKLLADITQAAQMGELSFNELLKYTRWAIELFEEKQASQTDAREVFLGFQE